MADRPDIDALRAQLDNELRAIQPLCEGVNRWVNEGRELKRRFARFVVEVKRRERELREAVERIDSQPDAADWWKDEPDDDG
jgi:uncharacterized protein YebE (UPF0316 family)